jgi:uncharacterized LabA/DUF88 family protein
MAAAEINNMAVFCDFENIALGVQDEKYDKFSIKTVLEKLLVKGSIVVKKAYCDWERYKSYKAGMHEAAFELIEIPHVRQSGKNSADIRMVVDALDLCYTKAHVDTFVVSGDSDFSPLVSKLRENNKRVIGVGVKASTSDLLIKNCDEFIFYDDLVRVAEAKKKTAAKKTAKKAESVKAEPKKADKHKGKETKERAAAEHAAPEAAEAPVDDDAARRRQAAIDLVLETLEELIEARGSDERIYSSMVKQALKRRRPEFNESYHGYKGFAALLDDMVVRGLLVVTKDEKTGQHLVRLAATE